MSFYIIKKKHCIDLGKIVDIDLQNYGVVLEGKSHHSLTKTEIEDLIATMAKEELITDEMAQEMLKLVEHYKTSSFPPND